MAAVRNVNFQTRRAYAELLRHFLAGRLITDAYEAAADKLQQHFGSDGAVEDVFAAVWHLYDDLKPHRMTGRHHLTPELRRRAARWVLFLRSGSEYGGHELRPDHPARSRVRRSRLRDGLWLFSFACTLIGLVLAFQGVAGGIFLFIVGAATLVLVMMSGGGMSLNPQVLARAFADETDPWPFASVEDLNRAVATPTYLHG
jgi:hypothetical protein